MKKFNELDSFIKKINDMDFFKKKNFNMLSIDGGGSKGIFATELFTLVGKERYNKFNVITGTSIGGIIALAYEVIPFYEVNHCLIKFIKKVFKINKFQKLLNIIFYGSIYSSNKVEKFVKKVFGNKKMKDLGKDKLFFITTTNFNESDILIINNLEEKWGETYLWEVALWTSNAPFYFANKNFPYVDGGLFANDPRSIYNLINNKIKINKENAILSIGFSSREKNVKIGRWIWNGSRISKFMNLAFSLSSAINNREFQKKSLRVELDNTGNTFIALDEINDEIIKFFKKRAHEEKDKVIDFIEKNVN